MLENADNIRRRIAAGETVSLQERQAAGISDQETQELQNRNRSRLGEIAGRRAGGDMNTGGVSGSSNPNGISTEPTTPARAKLKDLRDGLDQIVQDKSIDTGNGPVNRTARVAQAFNNFGTANRISQEASAIDSTEPADEGAAMELSGEASEIAGQQLVIMNENRAREIDDLKKESKNQKSALPSQ